MECKYKIHKEDEPLGTAGALKLLPETFNESSFNKWRRPH